LKPMITAYFHFIAILLFYLSIELGYVYAITPYVWFFIVMLGIFILYPWRTAVYWFAYLFFLIISARILSFIFVHNKIWLAGRVFYPEIKQFATHDHNYIAISVSLLFAFIIFCFFLYYLHRFQELKIQSLSLDTVSEKEPNEPSSTENGKLKALYMQIEKHFENTQPFVNPDFTIIQLASALNTNITYVSRAIKQERDINFSVFINHYRIKKVKEMLHDKSNRYTLEYVAAACGFRHQSTFNKVFKLIEGVTPSSYCNKYRQETSSN
jgi:AraC-like DNA-binding protein